LEDGVPLFVGPTWFGSGVSEWLPRINQYDLKGLLSFQVFLLTFFYTLAMLPCSSLVRHDHSTHLSDGNNQARKKTTADHAPGLLRTTHPSFQAGIEFDALTKNPQRLDLPPTHPAILAK